MKPILFLKDFFNSDYFLSVGDVVDVFHFEFGHIMGEITGFSHEDLILFTASGQTYFMSFSSIFAIEKCV